ncbi:MAG: lysylphosphatidylglycerol synthase domain-containing protein, partial [candidate division WOR-3 bacterium]|nr:lysylphosphatidylglycerol synthase domain-containing protein [candidate division WOR-3 bacterium]
TLIFPFASKQLSPQIVYSLFSLIPIFFVIIYPPIFSKIINFILKILKRPYVKFKIKYYQILKLLLLYAISWVIQGISIYFLILSFYRIDYRFLIPLCGIFPIASAIGFIVLVTPGGLGVREGVLSYLFKFYMPTSIGIVTSILIRIWATIGEVLTFLFFAKSLTKYFKK